MDVFAALVPRNRVHEIMQPKASKKRIKTRKINTHHLLHDEQLVDADGEDDLQGAERRDLGEGGEAVGDVVEGDVVLEGEHARQPRVLLCEVAGHREHGDAAVLDLDVAQAVEPLLVGVGHEAEGVPEPDRGLRADLRLEGHLHGGVGRLGRGEGSAVECAVFGLVRFGVAICRRTWFGQGRKEGERGKKIMRCCLDKKATEKHNRYAVMYLCIYAKYDMNGPSSQPAVFGFGFGCARTLCLLDVSGAKIEQVYQRRSEKKNMTQCAHLSTASRDHRPFAKADTTRTGSRPVRRNRNTPIGILPCTAVCWTTL